jgi:hypothetical protein
MGIGALLACWAIHGSDSLGVRELLHDAKKLKHLHLADNLIHNRNEVAKQTHQCGSAGLNPLRIYIDGGNCCAKLATVLASPILLTEQQNSTDQPGSCDNPIPRQERAYSVPAGSWPQPSYRRQARSHTLAGPTAGRVLLWKVERGDGCGTHAQYLLYTWALAHRRGWTFAGEIPLAVNHHNNLSDFVFFNSNCNCMKRFTGIPETLRNRLRNDLEQPAAAILKDAYAITTDCTGSPEAILSVNPSHKVNRAAFRHFKSRNFSTVVQNSTTEVNVMLCQEHCPGEWHSDQFMARVCLPDAIAHEQKSERTSVYSQSVQSEYSCTDRRTPVKMVYNVIVYNVCTVYSV